MTLALTNRYDTSSKVAAQHSVHLTGGSLRVFEHFSRLSVDSDKIASSHPAHQQVTHPVGRPYVEGNL